MAASRGLNPSHGSVTTMGYGDIVPVTDVERIFTLGVALVGAVVFSYCMASVSTLISEVCVCVRARA